MHKQLRKIIFMLDTYKFHNDISELRIICKELLADKDVPKYKLDDLINKLSLASRSNKFDFSVAIAGLIRDIILYNQNPSIDEYNLILSFVDAYSSPEILSGNFEWQKCD